MKPPAVYFDHVVEIVDEAASLGPRVFTIDNLPAARGYGRYVASSATSKAA